MPKITKKGFSTAKHKEAHELVERLTSTTATKSGSLLFDLSNKQMLLDNLLRGGVPEILGNPSDPKVDPLVRSCVPEFFGLTLPALSPPSQIYHTFSRIHGDLERDYNYFQIDSTYYSSG